MEWWQVRAKVHGRTCCVRLIDLSSLTKIAASACSSLKMKDIDGSRDIGQCQCQLCAFIIHRRNVFSKIKCFYNLNF